MIAPAQFDTLSTKKPHHRDTEDAEKTKIQQNQQERRSISPYSQGLEIVIPLNPVNPASQNFSLLDRICPALRVIIWSIRLPALAGSSVVDLTASAVNL
jgi:hypothetical protein